LIAIFPYHAFFHLKNFHDIESHLSIYKYLDQNKRLKSINLCMNLHFYIFIFQIHVLNRFRTSLNKFNWLRRLIYHIHVFYHFSISLNKLIHYIITFCLFHVWDLLAIVQNKNLRYMIPLFHILIFFLI
jgi:hypothetical protein